MAKIVCDVCDASFDDEGLEACPVCGAVLPIAQNDEQKNEASAEVEEIIEVEEDEVVKPVVEEKLPEVEVLELVEEPVVEEKLPDADASEELKPTSEFEYSSPFSEGPLYDDEVAEGVYNEVVRMMESVTLETPYVVYKKIADKLETISGYKNSDDLRKVCLEKAEILRKDGLYKSALALESSSDPKDVEKAILMLTRVLDYKDAKDHIELCNEKLDLLGELALLTSVEIDPALNEKIKEKRIKEKKVKEKKVKEKKPKKNGGVKIAFGKKLPIIISAAVALVVAIALLTVLLIVPTIKYNNAEKLLERGKYNEAYSAFQKIDDFKDSEEKMELIVVLFTMAGGAYDDAGEDTINAVIDEMLKADHNVRITYNHGYEIDGAYKKDVVEINHEAEFLGVDTLTRGGYEFAGFVIEDFGFKDGKANITLKAIWDGDYSIKIDLDGGENKDASGNKITYPDEYSITDGEDIVFVNPTKAGYTFAGWTGSGISEKTMELKLPKGSFGDKEYKANWTANEYKLTYDANGGTVSVMSATVVFGSEYEMPVPVKSGYVFKGWADEKGNVIEQKKNWSVASNLNLKAVWETEVYYITYDGADSAGNSNLTMYTVSSPSFKLDNPKKDGYKFVGWYSDSAYKNKITQIDTSVLADITVYAKWTLLEYTIVYESEGTIAKKYLTFTVEDLPFKLPADDDEDDFKCWVDDDYNEITSIDKVGDTVVRAKYYDSSSKTYYIKDTEGYIVYEYNGSATTVDLSKKYNGEYIIGIYDEAFADSTKLTEVIIGPYITFIGESAFEGCTKLDTVEIPKSVEKIGKNAFLDCDSDLEIECLATSKPSGWDKKWYGDSDYVFAD